MNLWHGWCLHKAAGPASWAPNEDLQQPRRLSVPFVDDHRRARENGGEKKGKVEAAEIYCGGEDSTTNERERQEAEGHACSLMHRYRAVSLTLLFELVDSAASYKRSRSLLRIFLSKLRKHDLEHNRISLSTAGSRVFSLRLLTESNTDMKADWKRTASESAKRTQVFAGLYSSVHSSVSFDGSGLLMTAPKHFEAFAVEPVRCKVDLRRRCDNCISPEWSRFVVLVTAHAWRLVETHFEFPTSDKSVPTAMSAKSAFKILTGLSRYSSVRRLSSEERLAKLSRLSPSSLTYVWAAAKIKTRTTLEDLQQSASQ